MPACEPPYPPSSNPLLILARLVHRAVEHLRPYLVSIAGPLGGDDVGALDLMVRPLDDHPVDVLVGFDAPPSWTVLGVVASGTARDLSDQAVIGRTATTYLVDREGASASICENDDGSRWEHEATGLDDAAAGRIDDCLRRALRLPTRACDTPVDELWARLWLDELVAAVCADPAHVWSLPSATAIDPAARRPTSGWGDLRAACAAGTWSIDIIPPDVAGWMDDPMFARWLLDDLPDCGDLMAVLRDLAPRAVIRHVEKSLEAWGVNVRGMAADESSGLGGDP